MKLAKKITTAAALAAALLAGTAPKACLLYTSRCVEETEVIHASSIAKGAVRPKCKFAGDLRLQSVCLFLVQVQIVRIHLRGRHKAAAHHVGAQGDVYKRQYRGS